MAQRDREAGPRAGARSARAVSRERRPRPDLAPSTVDLRRLRDRLASLVQPLVQAAGLDLEELELRRAGRRILVRVTVDGDAGIGHDELSDLSRDLSAALDAAEEQDGELTPGGYTLEVSSPGVDRPLTLPRHWRRNLGRLVTVRAGERSVTGRVIGVDENGVRLEGVGTTPVAFSQLGPGRVQVEFTRLAELADEDFGEDWDERGTADHGAVRAEEEGA
jgi:ribosome maturation factor RimP